MLSPGIFLSIIIGYFLILLIIAWVTGRKADNAAYFLGNKASPWYAIAFGMIGDSLSGVTYISVPGKVGGINPDHFAYMQLVFGYFFGYFIIAKVLLPLYYRMNLTSIYSYLFTRFGTYSQKTGSFFFLLSRMFGSAARLFLAASVIQLFIFDKWGVPFGLTVGVIILLILIYTYKGGIKTLVWTDTFQSLILLFGVILSIAVIMSKLDLNILETTSLVAESTYSKIFFWDWQPKSFFFKQFLGGIFIAIAMTGLDQNMMQKNLSCRSLGEAQKNIYTFSFIIVAVNLLFLSLGALLYIYTDTITINNIPEQSDRLFPFLAMNHLGMAAAVVFILGLTASTFSSADSVLTTLTTSFCIDLLDMDKKDYSAKKKTYLRHAAHIMFAILLLLVILLFALFNNRAIIDLVLTVAGYTYGPLLGLFTFGILIKRKVKDSLVPVVALLSPVLCYFFSGDATFCNILNAQTNGYCMWRADYVTDILHGYQFGFELIVLNGLITFLGLFLISKKENGIVFENEVKHDA